MTFANPRSIQNTVVLNFVLIKMDLRLQLVVIRELSKMKKNRINKPVSDSVLGSRHSVSYLRKSCLRSCLSSCRELWRAWDGGC